MRIFWFTNIRLPELSQELGRQPEVIGGWMSALLDGLRRVEGVKIAVASIDPETDRLVKHEINGVSYFLLPLKRSNATQLTKAFIDACSEALKDFKPDIIHVHGTEDVYGLFTTKSRLDCPSVISIQGLLHIYCRYVRGGLTLRNSLDAGKEGLLAWLRFLLQEMQWMARGRVERQMIAENKHFIGRTAWDKAHILAVNPAAHYYHGDEMLRAAFYTAQWDMRKAVRHSIFCTAAHSPLKGFHWLLYAVALLREEFPVINVRVAGAPWDESKGFGYYGRYIKSLIEKYDLSSHITPLPALSAEDVARELRMAHAFVIPSLIENSPNSLAEAMLVGTPCIAAYVGGIPSMINAAESALCFPSSDAAYLAQCIRRVFTDDSLAQQLSKNARGVALARHDPNKLVDHQLALYQQVVADSRGVSA